jgi:hypothetical protein
MSSSALRAQIFRGAADVFSKNPIQKFWNTTGVLFKRFSGGKSLPYQNLP